MKDPSNNAIKYLNKSSYYLPDESFTYGKGLRPSTPIRAVLSSFYGNVAEQMQ